MDVGGVVGEVVLVGIVVGVGNMVGVGLVLLGKEVLLIDLRVVVLGHSSCWGLASNSNCRRYGSPIACVDHDVLPLHSHFRNLQL